MAPQIYVVDDDALVTESLGTALQLETDWQVSTFNDARAALDAMGAAPPDVVLSDLKMPALGGIGFLSRVRERFPDAVLMLLTGYADKESAIQAINEVGIWQYVEKPWDTGDLLVKIRQGLERRSLVEKLIASERMAAVGRVASGLAHELGNQIGLLGWAEAIAARTDDPEVREGAQVIVAAQRRLAAMVEEIKDFARGSDAGYAREPADLASVVEEALAILKFDGEVAQRKLVARVEARPLARMHRGKILQVLVNLVRNAAQASPAGGAVDLVVGRRAGDALVRVIDHGTGMTPEVLSHLGEPFFTTKERGSGLGLGISRRIVEEHGGRLEVSSRPGEGTEVAMALPAVE
jgi:signal transduction histidine kinase